MFSFFSADLKNKNSLEQQENMMRSLLTYMLYCTLSIFCHTIETRRLQWKIKIPQA